MEKFFLGIFWLVIAVIFWYNGASELINEADSFMLATILGNVYIASYIHKN